MNTSREAQQIRRWQEEVARDPASPSFVALADVYRREGRLDVARRLCVRGLERQPEHVEAHLLLGRIHRDAGELERACDELDIALHLDPSHRGARRALGYLFLERRQWAEAVRHLDAAAALDPHDPRLASALALARRHAAAAALAADPGRATATLVEAMQRFVRESRVRMVLLLETSGRIVGRFGADPELDLAAFASLAAGIHSASREMARMLGQAGFEQLFQGEGDRQLFFGSVATATGELIVATRFGTETSLGLVRVRFDELAREMAAFAPDRAALARDAAAFEAQLAAGLRVRDTGAGGPAPRLR